jgi:hypothetical protein
MAYTLGGAIMVMSVIVCWLGYLVSLAYPAGEIMQARKQLERMEQ